MIDKSLRDVVLNFVIAGRDTTAATLVWAIYMIISHEDVANKLYSELERLLNYDSLGKLYYLLAVITETLRLYPAVPQVRDFSINFVRLLTCLMSVTRKEKLSGIIGDRPTPHDQVRSRRSAYAPTDDGKDGSIHDDMNPIEDQSTILDKRNDSSDCSEDHNCQS
ncbi:unnamed protein product [Fraxinus pennsylvanica]|uniref:Cytochrome P450 n=1 Tax=Fraxinus pennsylvanica TaxID=56036 RepID=A0AAD2DS85_9LAMI|nr:unnamed protein product [Fraxinus pennsylvanica]